MRHVSDEHLAIFESHYGSEKLWLPDHGQRKIKYGAYRDSQRQKLYDSETDLTWKMHGRGRRFQTLDEMREYVAALIATDWWQERFPHLQAVTIENTSAEHAWAQCFQNKMGFPTRLEWCMTERILLHELAHLVVKDPHPAHGALYARVYLDLIQFQMGDEWADEMKKQFKRHKVRYTPYPKKAANQTCSVYAIDNGHRVKISVKLYEYLCEGVKYESGVSRSEKFWDTREHAANCVLNPVNQNRAFVTVEVENLEQLEALEQMINSTRWNHLPYRAVQVSAAAGRLSEAIDQYLAPFEEKLAANKESIEK